MTTPVKAQFVPLAQVRRVTLEARSATGGGVIAGYGVRAVPIVEKYHRRGHLSARQHRAAVQLYRHWAMGVVGVRDADAASGAWQPAGFTDAQLDAAKAFREAVQFLGARLSPVVLAVCCDDLSAETLARFWRRDRKGVMEVLRLGLDMLGDFYALPDDG